MTGKTYRFYRKGEWLSGWWVWAGSREEWLQAILNSRSSPKPPASWVALQALEGPSSKSAAIIWGRNYDTGRKYAIWAQATEEDFIEAGYLR